MTALEEYIEVIERVCKNYTKEEYILSDDSVVKVRDVADGLIYYLNWLKRSETEDATIQTAKTKALNRMKHSLGAEEFKRYADAYKALCEAETLTYNRYPTWGQPAITYTSSKDATGHDGVTCKS